jgi:CheY-like chemotaxis protein
MTPYGLNIELATSGFEAIDKIKEGSVYDIVFMDHMMPKMDGIETTTLLRDMGYTRPIVALTANAIAGQAEVFLRSGFDGFISKPIDIRQLNIYLIKLIRDKQSPEVIEAAQREKIENEKKIKTGPEDRQIDPQLATIFARDAEKALNVLETILQNNFHTESDIQLYVINVHSMKSALANINKMELSGTALRLEQAGRKKEINVMASETHKFMDALRAVIKEITPKEEANVTIEDTEEALAYLREKLVIFKEACISFDKKSAKNTLNELREKAWSHKVKDMLNSAAERLLHSEFDTAIALVDEFLK